MLIIDAITSAFTRLVDLGCLVICLAVRIKKHPVRVLDTNGA